MSEHGAIWRFTEPVQSYTDGRFDGGPLEPPQDKRIFNRRQADGTFRPLSEFFSAPPLDPQQPTPEQIADAAREALADMQLVLRIWPFGPLAPLTWMRALERMLMQPAPAWQAKDEDE